MSRASQRRMRAVSEDSSQVDALNEAEQMFNIPPSQSSEQEDLIELINQRENLDRKIAQLKAEQRKAALNQIMVLIQAHGFTASDVFHTMSSSGARKPKAKAAPKYRDPSTGQMWSGRGKPPRWYALSDNKEALLIANQESTAE